MPKILIKDDVIANKKSGIRALNNLLESYISSSDDSHLKKADMISYWLKSYSQMLSFEERFDPSKNISYKRGNVIKADLGFNIGSEQGGLHYAVILDNFNPHNSPIVTIIPLSSVKPGKALHKDEVMLGDELYRLLKIKHATISKEVQKASSHYTVFLDFVNSIADAESLVLQGKASDHSEDVVLSRTEIEDTIIRFKNNISRTQSELNEKKKILDDVGKEISRMKTGSYALVRQITTISKIRILDPRKTSDVLNGISLSAESMDQINTKMKELFIR